MVSTPCSVHPDKPAISYCFDCDSHQVACLLCMLDNGKHSGHKLRTLEDGVQRQVAAAERLFDTTERKRIAAVESYKQQVDFEKQVEQELLQPLEQFRKTVDKLISQLLQVKVDVHTAVLRAAQTAQAQSKLGTDYAKVALAVRRAAHWVGEMRNSLKDAGLSNLHDLLDETPARSEKAAQLQEAMQAAEVDFHSITVNTSIDSRVSNELRDLSDRVGSVLQLSSDLVGLKPAKQTMTKQAEPVVQTSTSISTTQLTTALLQPNSQLPAVDSAGAANAAVAPMVAVGATQAQTQQKQILVLAGSWYDDVMAYDTSSDTWAKVASISCQRLGTAATLWQGKVVVAGGFNSTNKYLNTVEQFDLETNSWTSLPDMLQKRRWLALTCLDNTLYAIGGEHGSCLASVERFDSNTNQWQLTSPLNVQRAGLCCAVLEAGILAVGGSDGWNVWESCEWFDGAKQTWQLAASLQTARSRASASTVDEKVYVFGGLTKIGKWLDSVEEYAAGKWTLLPVRLSVARWGLAAATVNGRVYVCGGEPVGTLVESFDASKRQITRVAHLPKAFYGAAAASVAVSIKLGRGSSYQLVL